MTGGTAQSLLKADLIAAHQGQEERRALKLLQKGKLQSIVDPTALTRGEKLFYFKRGPKFGTWEIGFIKSVEDQLGVISSNLTHQVKPVRAALEDIRLIPHAPLLRNLDEIDFVFPRSYSIVDEDEMDSERFDDSTFPAIYPVLEGIDPLSKPPRASKSSEPPDIERVLLVIDGQPLLFRSEVKAIASS